MASPAVLAQTPTPVPVLMWRYDVTHSGANTQETALTPTNVASSSFGKLFSLSVDDRIFAQPLYVPNLKMSDGLVHNVLFVVTENDSVYAFDADTKGNPIWKISLLTAAYGAGSGATPVPQSDVAPSQDIGPNIGITGTPAINTATNTMYVVSNTKESGKYFSRLHAINIVTGAEQSGGPANITATVAGTGDGSSNGELAFSPVWTNQRSALNYYNGYVYIAYSSHGDVSPFHGWVFAYDAATLKQTAAICLSPDDQGSSVWASGAGMPIDASTGRMYLVTSNGARGTPFQSNSDYGESVIAFNLSNGELTPTDAWTAFNYAKLNTQDWDQGAGGLLMLPDQPGSYPHLIITAGKEGRITVLNRDKLGGLASGASSNTNAVQDITLSSISQGQGFWGTAAYWNGNVYEWAGGDDGGTPNVGMAFKLSNGTLATTPSSETTFTSAFPDPTFSVSSNGTQDGIVWAVKADQFNSGGPAVLYAFDPNDLSNIFYASNKKSSDSAGPANKFSVPVVTNGKVYVAAKGEVDVYGLMSTEPAAVAPTISPEGGTFSTSQTVTMSTTTSSAVIYYTLDGSTPTTASTAYTGAITISSDTTVKAIATAPGYSQSSVSSATFTIGSQGGSSFNFTSFASTSGLTLNGTAVAKSSRLYLTTNVTWQAGSAFWNTPIDIQKFTTTFDFQVTGGTANGFTFTIQNAGPTALGGDSGGLAYQNIQKSVAVKFNFYNYENGGSDSTGIYTDGQPPVTPTVDISGSGIQLDSGDTIQAQISYDGTTLALKLLDLVTNKTFSYAQAINIPSTVGADAAYVGFTGGTGGLSSNMEIINWTYSASTQAPSFSLNGKSFVIGWRGGVIHVPITVTPSGGFTGKVPLNCSVTGASGAVSIPACTISEQPATITGTSSVTGYAYVTTQKTTSLGSYVLHVNGTYGSLSESTSISFTVN